MKYITKNRTKKTTNHSFINKRTIKIIAISSLFYGLAGFSTVTMAMPQANEPEHQHQSAPHDDHKDDKKEQHQEEHDDGHNDGHDDDHGDEHQEKTEEDGHGHGAGGHEEEAESGVELSASQLSLADIKVTALTPRAVSFDVYAPGEIKANDYTGYLVSPRVDSVVLKRHVALGDHVEKNQALVTLFSETVADAQASYRIANAEWQRVQKLGRKAVGDKRYLEAQTSFEAGYGRLLAFGLSQNSIKLLNGKSSKLGQYTLTAATSGAVLSDDFRQGQRVESGDTLIELADEKTLWAEARLAPSAQLYIPVGSKARVKVGDVFYPAKVTQKAHTIDPVTRTRIVRLQVDNIDHKLHPGLFADIYFSFSNAEMVLAVPEEALIRGGDGDWMVFVEENGEFSGKEIELGRSLSGNMREIIGIESGTKVVTQGAFYVSAEIAKGGFDAHNH
jgi:RND family efflux transporter MFP subunit